MNSTGLKEAFRESNKTKVKKAWAKGEKVQFKVGDEWVDWNHPDYLNLGESLWRIKPKALVINGHEVPEPFRGKTESKVYVLEVLIRETSNPTVHDFWEGRVHKTYKGVSAHRKALMSFTTEEVNCEGYCEG